MKSASRWALAAAALLGTTLVAPVTANADGSIPLYEQGPGCLEIGGYGAGLLGDGAGTIEVPDGRGTVVAAFVEWAGSDDLTPQNLTGEDGRADSTLTIGGTEVIGDQPPGAAGYSSVSNGDWYAWSADIGPTGLGLITTSEAMSVDVSGWDTNDDKRNNGATISIIYETDSCDVPSQVELQTGVDYYYYARPEAGPLTELLVFDFEQATYDRVATAVLTHAGTQATQSSCRGKSLWMLAGGGAAPGETEFDIVENSGPGNAGVPVNGGVEIVRHPFSGPNLPCEVQVNPTPDTPAPTHTPFPAGAADAPYRAVSIDPPDGGDVGPEWAIARVEVIIPAGTTWIAFQLESEPDRNGESGSWAGGAGFEIEVPVTEPVPLHDVELTKGVSSSADGPFEDGPITVDVGSTAYFAITVEAKSEAPDGTALAGLTEVSVNDVIPPGLTFVEVVGDADYDAATSTWNVGELPAGTSQTLTFAATVDNIGLITNEAQVDTHGEPDIDSTPGNWGGGEPAEDDEDFASLIGQSVGGETQVPSTTTTAAPTPTTAPSAPTTTAPPGEAELPKTGSETGNLTGIAALLVALGCLAVAGAKLSNQKL